MIKDEWVKSSRSNGNGGNNCVQVRMPSHPDSVAVFVRNSRRPVPGEMLSFTRDEWQAFIDGVKAGEFDL